MTRSIPRALASLLAGALTACVAGGPADEHVRGRGLQVAELPAAEHAAAFAAATRAAFDIVPSLTLLLDPVYLPRTEGYEGGEVMPARVRGAILGSGLVQGTCTPVDREARAPTCDATNAGYVLRASQPFRMSGDSLQLHLLARRYDTAATGAHQPFRFEGVYQLVKRGGRWTVVRQGRLKQR